MALQASRAELAARLGIARDRRVALQGMHQLESSVSSVNLFRASVSVDGGQTIPCLVYEPRGRANRGSVIALHQHNNNYALGKSEVAGLAGSSAMAYGLRAATEGHYVIMPDLRGFEDRRFANDVKGELLYALNCVAAGGSLHGEYVSDVESVVRAFTEADQLVGDLSVIGHSLGGQIAYLCLAALPYFSNGVISSGVTTVEACRAEGVLHNPGWYVPGILETGDYSGLASLLEGKSTLLLCSRDDDYFPATGARDVIAAIPDGGCQVVWRDGGHDLTHEALDAIGAWYARM